MQFLKTPDPRPASGSHEPMNAPRVELHRHENFHQLNQVNVPKVELHQHDLRQLNHVYVGPQVDPQILAEAVGVVSEARAHVANVERDARIHTVGERSR